jgi:hypothetical protein
MMVALGAIAVSASSWVVPLAAATLRLPISPGGRHLGSLRSEHRELGVGVGRGEHDLLGALGCETHDRDHDVDLVGQQEGDAVGAGDLLHLELHAQRLGDHAGQFDVEAFGLALCVLRPEWRHVERRGDAHGAFLEDVLEGVGLGSGSAKGRDGQGQQACNPAFHDSPSEFPYRHRF